MEFQMSTAFDLTEPVSVPDLDGEPANDPGPQTSWHVESASTGSGDTMCAPPVECAPAPGAHPCAGLGDTEACAESRPQLPDGSPYPGDLLTDILEYRRFRSRVLGGGRLAREDEARYVDLYSQLRAHDEDRADHGRAFLRFDVHMPATLRVANGSGVQTSEVGVDNISAGGVKLIGAKARAEGERVELLMDAGDGRTVVLPARVAWMRGQAVGLMFAGAARWR
jgi:hypothetical protein